MERARAASMPTGRSLQNRNRSAPPPKIINIHPAKYKAWRSHEPRRIETESGRRRAGPGRRRTESRYIEEPGRSRIKISHRRGSEYHKPVEIYYDEEESSDSDRESIIDVSSSRYVDISDSGHPCGAELILQPRVGDSERALQPLLNWM